MVISARVRAATRAASIHLALSLVVALLLSILVFGLWYPDPYSALSGGRELFLLVMAVDVVCGPLFTAVLFNPAKPRPDLWRDLTIVTVIQAGALCYGLWTVWQARPLFLVQEIDRFKVIAAPDLHGNTDGLRAELQPRWWSGPMTVAIREPKDSKEYETVLFDSVQGGRGYAERTEFYLEYEGAAALKSLRRAQPLETFLRKQPAQRKSAQQLAADRGLDMALLMYLPVVGREDWVAILDDQGQIKGFLKGDGF